MSCKLIPVVSSVRNNDGGVLYVQGRYTEDVKQLERWAVYRLYGSRAKVFEVLGVSYLKLERLEDADAAFTRSMQLDPNQPRATLELAQIRFIQLRHQEARQLLFRHNKVSQPSARSLWLGVQLARIYTKSDDEASLALALKNIFPTSKEYQLYKDSNRNL